MQRFSLLTVGIGFCAAFVSALGSEVDESKSTMKEIVAVRFDGALDDYPAFVEKQGTALSEQADRILALRDVSAEDISFAVDIKQLGITLRYGTDQAEYERKLEKFLESIKDIPEAKPRIRSIVRTMYENAVRPFHERKNSENVGPYREIIDRFAPLINTHFENAESNEQEASGMVFFADICDPDGSAGLVLHAVEQLKPTLESHRKRREFDLLRYCAEDALAKTRRIQMPGKELEFQNVDLKGNLVDAKDHRGKFVLLVFDASRTEENIPALKKIHNALHEDSLVLIEYDTNYNTEITVKNAEKNEIPWIVTSLGAGHQKKDVKDYREVYGSRQTMLLADRNGIVLKTRSDGVTSELCEILKSHFPDKAAVLDEVATELKAIADERERKKEELRRNRVSAENSNSSPANLLQKILNSLFLVEDSEGIAATVKRDLAETMLKFPGLSQEARLGAALQKVYAMMSLGGLESKRNPEKRPELVFAELSQYFDEIKKEAQGTHYYHNVYLFPKLRVFHSMREYLKRCADPVEYVQEIIDKYIAFAKEEIPNIGQTLGGYNIRVFVMVFQENLEEIDTKHSTQLLATFLGQLVPIFEASSDLETQQYARQLSGAERRSSLIGKELEFECVLIDGKTINVKDLRGKVVLINFWATTCGPCRAEFPNMKKLHEKYKPLGYEMIAYSCGDDDETLKTYVEKEQHPWLVGSLLMSKRNGVKDYNEFYGIRGIPTTFLLDRNGLVRFMMVGADDETLNREVDKLFPAQ